MIRRIALAAVLCAASAAPALAQGKAEVSGYFGYTASDGVPITATPINGVMYNRVDPANSMAIGLTFGVFVTPQAEVEFLWSRQKSRLDVSGSGSTLSGDMNVDNFHGNLVYNFGGGDSPARLFVLGGLGVTTYGDAKFPAKTLPGMSRFSWAVGGGIKVYPSKRVGMKAMFRWTPTYIKTVGTGWWCDPWFGCYSTGAAYYANQFEFSGGVTLRF